MKRPNVTYCCSLTGLDMPDAGPEYVLSFAWTHRHNGHEYEHAHTQCTEACFQGKSGRGGPRERNEKKRKLKKKNEAKPRIETIRHRQGRTPTNRGSTRACFQVAGEGAKKRTKQKETKRNETKRNETKRKLSGGRAVLY